MKNYIYILFLIPCFLLTQNEQLRMENIDVFKEYVPQINNSQKISFEPIFSDTLQTQLIPNNSVINKKLFLKQDFEFINPNKFRFLSDKPNFKKHLFFSLGSSAFLNLKFHYTNGISTAHNTGVYVHHKSQDFLFNKDVDKSIYNSFSIYSNRFLKRRTLNTSFSINNYLGFYWGGMSSLPLDSIGKYNKTQTSVKMHLTKSTNHLLDDLYCSIYYLFTDHGRHESFFNTYFKIVTEKALKSYSFLFDFKTVMTKLDNSPLTILENPIYDRVAIIQTQKNISDIILSSQLLLTESKSIEYNVGFNFDYSPNDIDYGEKPLFFPTIHLIKKLNNEHQIEFNLEKRLVYNSFSQLSDMISYLDPYYRNYISRKMSIMLLYTKKLNNHLNFSTNLDYLRLQNGGVPFLFIDRESTLGIQNKNINSIGIYSIDIQTGFNLSSSISFDYHKINVLIQLNYNSMKANNYNNRQFYPKLEFLSIINIELAERINIISNWNFLGTRDAISINPIDVLDSNIGYVNMNSYLKSDLSIHYKYNSNIISSLNFHNIFNQKIEFFDGYYDLNGFRVSIDFAYKF